MNLQARRALVAATTGLALAVPMLALPSMTTSATAAPRADRTVNFGMKGDAAGARLIVNNVEVLSLNDSNAPLNCTRTIGRSNKATFPLSTPEGSPIELGAATNKTRSYRDGKRVGVRATSILAPLRIGDASGETTGGIPTPEIRLEGLTTVADAFHTPKGYNHKEKITELDLKIDLLPGQDADEPLQELLDAISTGLLQPVLEVLLDTVGGAPIEIPGLGSIGLGTMGGRKGPHGSASHASALKIVINATGEKQKLILGDAQAWMNGPAPSVVFGSTSMPMAVDVAEGAIRLGHIEPKPLPCSGTGGEEKVHKLKKASVLLPENLVAGIKGIEYRQMGVQKKNGYARGYQVSKIGEFSIPMLDLVIKGISSRAEGVQKAGTTVVRSTSKSSVAKVLYQGKEVKLRKPGKPTPLGDLGFLEARVITDGGPNGRRVTALRVTLTGLPTLIKFDLGVTGLRIFRG